MSISIHVEEDFSGLVQGESILLYPRGSITATPVPNALRGPIRSEQEEPADSAVVAADTEWNLQLPALSPSPLIGDTLVDSDGQASVILRTRHSPILNKWSLDTRSLSIPPTLADSVSLQRPIVEGGETVGWLPVTMAAPAQIALESISVNDPNANDPVVSVSYRVSLTESVDLLPGDRFVNAAGDVFLLAEVVTPDRLGASLSIRVVPESA